MIDRIAAKYGRTLHEHGIGFKYVVDLMLEGEILIGGEESGGIGISRHLPERDGLLNALLLANVMADEKKTLGELVAALQEEFGEHQYGRIDMHIDEELKQSAIARAQCAAGGRHHGRDEGSARGDDGWDQVLPGQSCVRGQAECGGDVAAAARIGTEPLLRVYCESCSMESVTQVLEGGAGVCAGGACGLSETAAKNANALVDGRDQGAALRHGRRADQLHRHRWCAAGSAGASCTACPMRSSSRCRTARARWTLCAC